MIKIRKQRLKIKKNDEQITHGSVDQSFSHLTIRGGEHDDIPKRPWSRSKTTRRPEKYQVL